jgi:hypothetical protein
MLKARMAWVPKEWRRSWNLRMGSPARLAAFRTGARDWCHRWARPLRSADLVQSDGAGRHEHFTLTDTGAKRLVGASAGVAAVQERMLATFDSDNDDGSTPT